MIDTALRLTFAFAFLGAAVRLIRWRAWEQMPCLTGYLVLAGVTGLVPEHIGDVAWAHTWFVAFTCVLLLGRWALVWELHRWHSVYVPQGVLNWLNLALWAFPVATICLVWWTKGVRSDFDGFLLVRQYMLIGLVFFVGLEVWYFWRHPVRVPTVVRRSKWITLAFLGLLLVGAAVQPPTGIAAQFGWKIGVDQWHMVNRLLYGGFACCGLAWAMLCARDTAPSS